MADPTWKTITAAIATKLATVPGIASATNEIGDSPPASLPGAVVWPPDVNLLELGMNDVYTAPIEAEILFSGQGGTTQMIDELYTVIDGLVPAWHSGRILGLPTIVTNSKITSIAIDAITSWGDAPMPGLRVTFEVQVTVSTLRSA